MCDNGLQQFVGDWVDDGGNTIRDVCEYLCPADLNQDGVVDGADLTFVLGLWGSCSGVADCPGDLTGDWVVGGADITVVLANWGACE